MIAFAEFIQQEPQAGAIGRCKTGLGKPVALLPGISFECGKSQSAVGRCSLAQDSKPVLTCYRCWRYRMSLHRWCCYAIVLLYYMRKLVRQQMLSIFRFGLVLPFIEIDILSMGNGLCTQLPVDHGSSFAGMNAYPVEVG